MNSIRFDGMLTLAFINGVVFCSNPDNLKETYEAVGINGKYIALLGSTEDILEKTDSDTEVIDLRGRLLTPGLIDSHFHPILAGLFGTDEDAAIINTNIKYVDSIAGILELANLAAKKRGPGQWISMMGYDQNSVKEKRHITLKELDQAAPDNPVQCMRTCGHICIYNSKALEHIGVYSAKDASKYPPGEIVVENGELTGMVKDHTHFKLWSYVEYSDEQQIQAALSSETKLLESGITSIHDPGETDKQAYHIMQKLCTERTFKPRSSMMLHSIFGKEQSKKDNEHWFNLGFITGLGNEYFRVGASKFMIDGGTSGPSSATRKPYSHDELMPGILGWNREEVADYIEKIHLADCQATAHAVGDLAIEFMVEGYEKAMAKHPEKSYLRHRVEHCTIVDEDLIERMARLDICPSTNPGFIFWNGSNYIKYYGERMKYFSALKSMMDAGIKVSIGSDSPSGPVESVIMLDSMVNRVDRNTGEKVDSYQCVSIEEALHAYTYNGAYSTFEEDIKGSLAIGKLADLAVFSENLLALPNEDIINVIVDFTVLDGKIVYSSEK
ncbi:MAG: amidohydrolase [Tissierellia bacterium]|nr:amidohydrolase [Tissierellia bacterium]